MHPDSPFKYVFWGLSIVVGALILGVMTLVLVPDLVPGLRISVGQSMSRAERPFFLGALAVAGFLAIGILATIAALVFRDARKRGLDPWCWATVATFVPNLIGVIIYLIVRSNVKKVCVQCGRGLQGDFVVCPYCGRGQQVLCPACRTPVSPGWKVCPFCARPLEPAEGAAPAPPNGR
ncbi:MAG: zinc ribbon domain-containing protein [Acidobacteria bacterium]|nr:zinc ribbon domain-containing protein [Acidobacteriota bacterium]